MKRLYEVTKVEPPDRISFEEFFRPRKRVTLVRLDTREPVEVLLPMRRSLHQGDVISFEDSDLGRMRAALGPAFLTAEMTRR